MNTVTALIAPVQGLGTRFPEPGDTVFYQDEYYTLLRVKGPSPNSNAPGIEIVLKDYEGEEDELFVDLYAYDVW